LSRKGAERRQPGLDFAVLSIVLVLILVPRSRIGVRIENEKENEERERGTRTIIPDEAVKLILRGARTAA